MMRMPKPKRGGYRRVSRRASNFHGWLGAKLKESGLDASVLARRAGVSVGHVSMLCHGKRRPSFRMVRVLTAALGVQAELADALSAAGFSDSRPFKLVHDLADRERVISEIGALFSSIDSMQAVLPFILKRVQELIAFDYGTIALVDWEIPEIRVLAHSLGGNSVFGRSPATEKPWALGEGLTGVAATTGRSVLVEDVTSDARYLSHHKETRSELVTPLKFGLKVIALLNLESNDLAHFTPHDQQTAEMIAPTIAAVLARTIEHQELSHLETQTAGLVGLCVAILGMKDEATLLQELAGRVIAAMPEFALCVVRVLDPTWLSLLLRGTAHGPEIQPDDEQIGYQLPLLESLSGRAVRSKPLIRRDVQHDAEFNRMKLAASLNLCGMIAIRIPAVAPANQAIGCISVYTTRDDHPLHESHVRLLSNVASFVAIALENLRTTTKLSAIVETSRFCRAGAMNSSTLDRIAQLVCDSTNAKAASIFLSDGERLELKGTTAGFLRPRTVVYDLGEGKTGWVAKTGKPIRIVERSGDDQLTNVYPGCRELHKWSELEARDVGKLSFMCVPIFIPDGKVAGVIRAVGRIDNFAFGPSEEKIVVAIADQLGLHLETEASLAALPAPIA